MEDHSSVDIGIRSVPVRLNEANVETEMIGESLKSLYVPASSESDTQVTHFNENYEMNRSSNTPGLSDELNEKLIVCQNSDNCALINGCKKFLPEDMKCVHISVNGINKCNNYELINAHFDQLNRTCADSSFDCTEIQRTEPSVNDSQISIQSAEESVEQSSIKENDVGTLTCLNTNIESSLKDPSCSDPVDITYLGYDSESQMPDIMRLIQKDLSEPYSIYTYRYFIHNWPKLCFLALYGDECVGAIVCKLDVHKKHSRRGYIAMLAVDEKYRKRKIGSNLVLKAIDAMVEDSADEVVLETEITNKPALKLYENLGFVRDKRLFRYYLNGVDALRLKLWLR